ncbi:Soluble aldose sugar dehydrogenase YliI precursor [Phycisphaerae bacterium RAS1]|nr:Soluble aldose sugar dehydrogenase YliI precursor [Phycisphaerae bacterium RAS1]
MSHSLFSLRRYAAAGLCLAGLALAAERASAAGTPLTTTRIINGLARPLFVTAPPGDFGRIFIVEQFSGTTGRIRILNIPGNTLNATPYLSVSPVSTGNEQGLLGLAFHPDFLSNGYFWVNYTNNVGTTVIARYRAMGDPATAATADPASATTVLTIAQPFTNHNGGWIAFGPDGYLYVGMGDGGSANDPNGNAQNINVLLGKMLRIDVDGADGVPGNDDDDGAIGVTNPPYTNPPDNPFVGVAGADEIWAYGLRNPWRNSFDRLTGDLFIADVGQNVWEEVNFQPAASAGGENYGWRCMEGDNCTGLSGCICEIGCGSNVLRCPFTQYQHVGSYCSITGGYVYRGCRIWDLRGTYFYSDYCANHTFALRYDLIDGVTSFEDISLEIDPPGSLLINAITSHGEDAAGEIYICDQGGEIYKLIPNGPVVGDCNADGTIDILDINPFADLIANASYDYVADINLDNADNILDINPFVALLANPCP